MQIDIVPATAEHLCALYGEVPGPTVRAFVAIEHDVPKGVGGTYLDGDGAESVCFFKVRDDISRRAVARLGRRIVESFRGRVWAVRDAQLDHSDTFLRHFGFTPVKGDLWLWT